MERDNLHRETMHSHPLKQPPSKENKINRRLENQEQVQRVTTQTLQIRTSRTSMFINRNLNQNDLKKRTLHPGDRDS